MPQYVFALHNFVPEHEDEIAFEAGQAIEVIEKDDQYNDGWWQGRNIAGKIGLFPQSYATSSAPPPGIVSTSSSASSTDPITTPPDPLSPLAEDHDSTPLRDGDTASRIGIAIGEPDRVHTEVMKATMTDVQKAIEQLGRNDRDGAQSFSFSSTRDGDTDRDTDGTETDGEIGEGWHRSARDKLAEQARKVVEAQAAEEAREAQERRHRPRAPPIDVEMSDESEAEEDDAAFQHLQHMHFTRDHPHIPEEEEEEEARRNLVARDQRRKNSNETSSAILPNDEPSSPEEEVAERTARANQTSFVRPSSPPRFTRSPIPNDRRSPKFRNATSSPDAISIAAPVPIAPMGVPMTLMTTSPEPGARRTPTPSITRDIPAALPSPTFTSSGTRQHSRKPSLQNSVSSIGKGSATWAPETEALKKSTPSEWTVDDVVEWLKSKGFGSDVYDKFIEQEITGDVLLELDINLLKVEIGIVAFGKRMRIANAIAEIRFPPSIVLTDHQPQHVQSFSQSFSHAHSPSGSTQHSLNSPMFASMGSTLNGPPSSTLAGPGSLDSPKADAFTSPLISKRMSSFSSAGASVNGGGSGSAEGASVTAGTEKAGVTGLGLRELSETRLSSSPSESAVAAQDEKPDEPADEDRGAQSDGETAPASSKARRRLFGLSSDSHGSSGKETPGEYRRSVSPMAVSATPRLSRRESQEDDNVAVRHARFKRTTDVVKGGTERLSLFGGTFTTSIGRSRKPAPRVTSTLLEDSSPTEKSAPLSLSRLYSSRKTYGRVASDASTVGSPKNGSRISGESKSFDKTRDMEKGTPTKLKPTELKEAEPSRKQTGTPQDGRAGSRGPNALKPGKSIVEQIGQPDHHGWMRKKGDHYNSWKLRFFIIKGPHLYILRSNSKAETKIKGYVNIVGYKVVADENIDPGRYGFRIVHETDKTHFFSSDEQTVVREWMKAIMKATIGRDYSKPVVSSVNIPTIPLTVAQAMNPAPRPPSPTARAATQKALRRENPNQLSTRDARILMGLPSSDSATRIDDNHSDRPRVESFFANRLAEASESGSVTTAKNVPPRPSRETRRVNASMQSSLDLGIDPNLVEWANSHLPRSLQVTDPANPLFGGLALLRLAEDMMGKSATPPIPDSAFPSGPNDDKLDGLFRLFDFLLDNDVKMGSVSINDVRQGKRDKVMQLLKALKSWQDRRKEIVKSLGQGGHPIILPVSGNSWR
ncbi:hypothetical protein JVT61DRAFT_5879 [Boletus reticuloceps]|uniref:Uncharacterized protein n=1 Tax=Boletus reticuloceps TaxID=495285 RepID=A0A8I2YKW4_9AGAM|nr:hypothetical protein JVT61DRAFT_5879 [Boletus reticuloceps]